MGTKPQDWLSAAEAVQRLDVKLATLYAYASRGLVSSVAGPKGRARRYNADDIARLKQRHDARSGHAPVAASALRWGEPVIETSISEMRADGPAYRGRSLHSLLDAQVSFERASELLWSGALPDADVIWQARKLKLPAAAMKLSLPEQPIAGWAALLGVLGLAPPFDTIAIEGVELERARNLTLLLASSTRHVRTPYLGQASVAERLLKAYGAVPRARSVESVDRALMLSADHELNASTFAARVTASTGASLCAALSAAAHTLTGPRHGGMCTRVEALLSEAQTLRQPGSVVQARLARGEAVPGFGHTLYPHGDPRGLALLAQAARVSRPGSDYRCMRAICDAMERAEQPKPSLDAGLVMLTTALGLPRGAAAAIFALGRMAGWVAHILEQRRQDFVLRPRARFAG